jgi:hypothetical protein
MGAPLILGMAKSGMSQLVGSYILTKHSPAPKFNPIPPAPYSVRQESSLPRVQQALVALVKLVSTNIVPSSLW